VRQARAWEAPQRHHRRLRLPLFLFLVACGGSSPKTTSTSSTTGVEQPTLVDHAGTPRGYDCVEAVNHVLDVMTPGGKIVAMATVESERCTADYWSASARACMATAMSREQGQACHDRELTNEQRKNLGQALLALSEN